jgi:subfamily B ATP-binding cassette protein MsbA
MSRFSILYALIRPYRGRLATAIALTVLFHACSLTPPLALGYLLDKVVIPASTTTPSQWVLLPFSVGLLVFIPFWNAFLAMINRVFIAAIGQRLVVDMRTTLFTHVLNLEMRYHAKVGPGPLMNRLMGDVGIVQNMVTGETLGIVGSIVALLLYIGIGYTINWQLATVMVVCVSLCAVSYYRYAQLIRKANLELREIMDHVSGQLQERLAGVRLVKTYCRERDETDAFLASTNRALDTGLRSQMLSVSLNTTARLIGGIGSTVVWCGSCYFILKGQMTYGGLQIMNTYFWGAMNPAIMLTQVADTIVQAMASLDRIMDVRRREPEIVESPDARELPACVGDLCLDRVHFAYEADTPLFEGLTLHIPAGKMTALVGHTGCGKTTVTSLLMRLWDVQGGRVLVDGQDVRDITLRSLRRHIGVVPQDAMIFEGTVFDNIAYGLSDATQAQVEEAARAAQIHDTIAALSDGYASWLGKGGVQLSVGQKQRITIARAILRKPAILIMDEATSSLDSESEAEIQAALRTVLHNRTSVVVAHRLSTIVEADQIVAMDKGKVIEIGTHDALMAREDGYYRRLYEELKGKHAGEVTA